MGDQRTTRDTSIAAFAQVRVAYFQRVFEAQHKADLPWYHVNWGALLLPWFMAAARGMWPFFWIMVVIDVAGLASLLQYFKYDAAWQIAAAAGQEVTMQRFSTWIVRYIMLGLAFLLAGRLFAGFLFDRLYNSQFGRWRIDAAVPSGFAIRRLVLGLALLVFLVPITLYRATQVRVDERQCLNQITAGEAVRLMQDQLGLANLAELRRWLDLSLADARALEASFQALDVDTLSDEQDAAWGDAVKTRRAAERDLAAVAAFEAITLRHRLDCWFIDDFPILQRIRTDGDYFYRRPNGQEIADAVAAQELAPRIIRIEKPFSEPRFSTPYTFLSDQMDKSVSWTKIYFSVTFDAIVGVMRNTLNFAEVAFVRTPWWVVAFVFIALSWTYAGRWTTGFVVFALAYIAYLNLWQTAMATMALVVIATLICVLIGLPVGIWMAKNRYARWITEPILDIMQTIPSLSYLVPAVAFLSTGQPPAIVATVIFAIPPMIKLTALGIRQVPESTKEAALAFGAKDRQLLTKVELPMAIPSIMAGLNQTVMLALSMATIAAFIGAGGLGAIVTDALGNAETGKGLYAGFAIAFVAIVVDRILNGIRQTFSRV